MGRETSWYLLTTTKVLCSTVNMNLNFYSRNLASPVPMNFVYIIYSHLSLLIHLFSTKNDD